jgi:hypothetical protein
MLKDPFPSPPGRPGKYVLYLGRADDEDGLLTEVHIWAEPYAALKFLELVLDEDDFEIDEEGKLWSETGITVECDLLAEVLEHDYTVAEAIWQLPHPHNEYARRFRRQNPEEAKARMIAGATAAVEESRVRREKRKAGGGRRGRGVGMTTIGDLAKELEMHPRDCRAILRKAIKKPAAGWEWKNEELDGIREILRKGKKG